MSLRITFSANEIESKQWEEFVYNHPQGNIFQTPQMYKTYCATKNYQPIIVACYEEDTVVGILLAVVQKEYRGFLGKLSARSIIWGGPLVKDNNSDILNMIIDVYDKLTASQAVYSQIRNLSDMSWAKSILVARRYLYEDHLNILVNLEKSEKELWKDVHPNRRTGINRAKKNGLQFRILSDGQSIKHAYSTLKDVYHRARMPLADLSLFLNLFALPETENPLRLFAAFYKDEIAGIMVTLCYREKIYEWYAGGAKRYFDKFPNDMVPWEVFLWGKSKGYKVFDFGGAGKPGVPYGVRDFKLKFGGELVDFGRFEKVHQPIKMKIAKAGFWVWQLMKK